MTTLPPQKVDDPRGWLTFDAPLPDDLQNAEDSTQHHDYLNSWRGSWLRTATPTERSLLAALGYEVPDELDTLVTFKTLTVRQRRWLALEPAQEAS